MSRSAFEMFAEKARELADEAVQHAEEHCRTVVLVVNLDERSPSGMAAAMLPLREGVSVADVERVLR